ncbi:sushi, nidogen and EGF-like domain-containing protein 1 [Pituophis catenifer annectens]|uniref:sushi, nidogen and EGF-like domain-containing protein 1 n=1 Tax=Pituophis catenifer annectens TaxID=94852 RepID=UPI0039929195
MESFYIFLLLAAGLALPCLTASPNTSLLYPYGKTQGDSENPVADDGNSPKISIKMPFSFYGKKYNFLFVNNNGVVSFGTYVSEYTPNAFPLKNGIAFVAPFWSDVDNRVSGSIFWRQTEDPVLLSRFAADLSRYHPDISFTPMWMFIATWDKVGYYGSASDKVNTFQAVLATDGEISFILLNYADIQWTTGTGNDGDIYTGLGGIPAQAGFDSGDKENYYNIPGSRTPEILNIMKTSNVDEPGRWLFQVDKSIIGVPTAKSDCLNK